MCKKDWHTYHNDGFSFAGDEKRRRPVRHQAGFNMRLLLKNTIGVFFER